MEKNRFSEFVEELALHFGQDKLAQPSEFTRKRLASWYSQVSHLPDEPLQWMAEQIKTGWDYFPRNLSKTMLELWERWYRENPSRRARHGSPDCPFCLNGWIMARPPKGRGYSRDLEVFGAAVKCGHCKQLPDDRHAWRATQDEIRAAGWEPIRPVEGGVTKRARQYVEQAFLGGER